MVRVVVHYQIDMLHVVIAHNVCRMYCIMPVTCDAFANLYPHVKV